jgi:hypothetical protein
MQRTKHRHKDEESGINTEHIGEGVGKYMAESEWKSKLGEAAGTNNWTHRAASVIATDWMLMLLMIRKSNCGYRKVQIMESCIMSEM